LLRDIARVLKFFAVCFGLLLALGILSADEVSARRNSSQTFAEKFLMHASQHPSQNLAKIDVPVRQRFMAGARKLID